LKDENSPYLSDRPDYNPTQIKGTAAETEWKNVNISMEADLKDVDAELVEQKQKQKYVQDLKNKLNII
jgi:maltooligosyltrehalose synthase